MGVSDELALFKRARQRTQDRIADAVTRFAGSMTFLYLHIGWFAYWIAHNLVATRPFDPFPFGLLTLIVSLEAIFLATFVMISQNREALRAEIRSQLDFETNVASEVWVEAIGAKLGIDVAEVHTAVQTRQEDARRASREGAKPAAAEGRQAG